MIPPHPSPSPPEARRAAADKEEGCWEAAIIAARRVT